MTDTITSENSITLEEAEKDFEAACSRAHKRSPLFIFKDNEPYLVVFDFHDYMERFGKFLPTEEYEQLKKLEKP